MYKFAFNVLLIMFCPYCTRVYCGTGEGRFANSQHEVLSESKTLFIDDTVRILLRGISCCVGIHQEFLDLFYYISSVYRLITLRMGDRAI